MSKTKYMEHKVWQKGPFRFRYFDHRVFAVEGINDKDMYKRLISLNIGNLSISWGHTWKHPRVFRSELEQD